MNRDSVGGCFVIGKANGGCYGFLDYLIFACALGTGSIELYVHMHKCVSFFVVIFGRLS